MHFGCMLKEIRLNGKQFYGPIVQEFLFRMNPSFDQIIFREVLGIIHHYCSSHLESLQLQNICIDAATGEKMRPLLRSLKKLQLYACEQANRACLFSEGSELVELDLEMTHSFDLKSYNFSKLESLSVSECKDNIGEWIDFITRHKNLKRLNFDINRYPEGIPAVLSLNHLQNFRLIISPEYMEHIDRLKELEHLEDFEIRCNGQNIAFVLNNVSFVDALNVLKCIDSKVDDQSIKEIVKFKNFKQLHIVNMKGLSKQYLLDIGDTLPQLELLHFTGFCDITSTGLAKIVKSLDKLKKLNLVATGYNLNQTTYQELVQIRRNKVQIFKLTIVIIEKICDGITRRWLDDWSRDYVEVFFWATKVIIFHYLVNIPKFICYELLLYFLKIYGKYV